MDYPKVVIVVLNWNGKDHTTECLNSLKGITYPNYTVLLVDNGSTDGSVEYFREQYPTLPLIENKANLGYAGGNNAGIEIAIGELADYILLLNNDTIVDPGFLDELVTVAESSDSIGIVGPMVYYYDNPGLINSAGSKMNWLLSLGNNIGLGTIDCGQYHDVREVDAVTGCALLIKAGVVEQIGPLDSRFFILLEDIDWCLRAKKHGYKIMFCPDAIVYHKESCSIRKVSITGLYYSHRNRILIMKKHYELRQTLLALLPMCSIFLMAATFYMLKGNHLAVKTIVRAYYDGIIGNSPATL